MYNRTVLILYFYKATRSKRQRYDSSRSSILLELSRRETPGEDDFFAGSTTRLMFGLVDAADCAVVATPRSTAINQRQRECDPALLPRSRLALGIERGEPRVNVIVALLSRSERKLPPEYRFFY